MELFGALGRGEESEGCHRSWTGQPGETSAAPVKKEECSLSISALNLGQSQTTWAEDAGGCLFFCLWHVFLFMTR